MARPIKETPILYGEDAERFMREMQRVERLSPETRAANSRRLEAAYNEFCKRVTICI